MKRILNISLFFIGIIGIGISLFYKDILFLSQFEIVYYRNIFFFIIGIYIYFNLKFTVDSYLKYSNNLIITHHSSFDTFAYVYKKIVLKKSLIFLLFSYLVFNFFSTKGVNDNSWSILIDTFIVISQYLYFIWLLIFIKTITLKESENFVLIIAITLNVLNIAGNTFGQNVHILLNPLVGWFYYLNLIEIEQNLLYVKLIFVIVIITLIFVLLKLMSKKVVKWHQEFD